MLPVPARLLTRFEIWDTVHPTMSCSGPVPPKGISHRHSDQYFPGRISHRVSSISVVSIATHVCTLLSRFCQV